MPLLHSFLSYTEYFAFSTTYTKYFGRFPNLVMFYMIPSTSLNIFVFYRISLGLQQAKQCKQPQQPH